MVAATDMVAVTDMAAATDMATEIEATAIEAAMEIATEIEEALAIETETVVTDVTIETEDTEVDSQVQPMTTTSGEEQNQKFPIDATQETKSDGMLHESVQNCNYQKDPSMKVKIIDKNAVMINYLIRISSKIVELGVIHIWLCEASRRDKKRERNRAETIKAIS